MRTIHITPAILTADVKEAKRQFTELSPYASLIQVDIIDGKFAPNRTITPKIFLDGAEFHLMVEHPLKYIDDCFDAHASSVIFHLESKDDPVSVIKAIKRRKMVPIIAINPETKVSKLSKLLPLVNSVQIMTVHPGSQGQRFILKMLTKIRELRKLAKRIEIVVDGGVNGHTAKLAVTAGATRLVVGSAIYKTKVPLISMIELCEVVHCKLD